jgi:hypothetical protein
MFFLVADVILRLLAMGRSHGKHPVAALPIEFAKASAERLDEFRRFSLRLLDELNRRVLLAHIEEDVNVIVNTSDDDPGRVHFAYRRCQKRMHAQANLVVQEWLAILGAEDQLLPEALPQATVGAGLRPTNRRLRLRKLYLYAKAINQQRLRSGVA